MQNSKKDGLLIQMRGVIIRDNKDKRGDVPREFFDPCMTEQGYVLLSDRRRTGSCRVVVCRQAMMFMPLVLSRVALDVNFTNLHV